MSAPDVERLVDRTPQEEAFDMLYRIRDIVGGIGAPDTIGKLDEQVRWMKEALNLHRSTIADLNAKLAALSSHPDPIPASADIAGRLAIAMRDLIDAIEKACEWDAEGRVGNAIAVAESLLAAYRANPSGWIPVGERLPDAEEVRLWCRVPVEEAPWVGAMIWDEWVDDYYTHHCDLPHPPQEGHSGMIYTKEELKKWWLAKCPECGWKGLSRDSAGGDAIADTGDYSDPVCPECIKREKWVPIVDADTEESDAAQRHMREGRKV